MGKYHTTPDVDPDDFAPIGSGVPDADELYQLRVLAGMSKNEAARSARVAVDTLDRAEDPGHDSNADTVWALLQTYREEI